MALVVALASIAWLLRFVARHSFVGFIRDRVLLAVVLVIALTAGLVPS